MKRSSRPRSSSERGFTLTELMVVVVIMSVMASLAFSSYKKQQRRAATTEVRAMIGSIAAAQETYRSLYQNYLNVSQGNLARLYPTTSPGSTKYQFYGQTGGNDAAAWNRLSPEALAPVTYGYATVAGLPGDAYPSLGLNATPAFPVANGPWYIIKAVGDSDGDGAYASAVKTSMSDVVYWENEGQ